MFHRSAKTSSMYTKMIQKLFRATALSLALIGFAQTAQAQYYGNYAYGLGSSLLYPLTYLPYQLLYGGLRLGGGYGGLGGYGGYGSSGYSVGNFVNQASYAPYGYVPYGGKFGLGTNQQYQNFGQYGNGLPGSNTPQVPYNNQGVVDQSYYQRPPNPQPVDPQNIPQNNSQNPAPQTTAFNGSTPLDAPQTNPPMVAGPASANSEYVPPTAPARVSNHTPFADGFIQVVNEKYDGNIEKALKDKQLHSWAAALSLVDPKSHHLNLSSSRQDVIAKILKDSALDSQSKLETLRILLK